MNLDSTPAISQDLIWRSLDDGAVIITPNQGRVRVLNEVGTLIWQLIDGQNTIGEIIQHIVENYDVTGEKAECDIVTFLDTLDEKGLISWK